MYPPKAALAAGGEWLARQFLDHEPGIHWPDANAGGHHRHQHHRVYNPIKQAQDHDPHGQFAPVVPALRRVPDARLLEPWRMPPDVQATLRRARGHDIAVPLVDLDTATRTAKAPAPPAPNLLRAPPRPRLWKNGSPPVSRWRQPAGAPGLRTQRRPAPQQQTLDF